MASNNRTIDRIQAVWNKLGGEEGVDRFLEGDQVVTNRGNVVLLGSMRLLGRPVLLPNVEGVFVGHHYFTEGTHRDGVLIRLAGEVFKERFFNVQEVNVKSASVTMREIEKPMRSTQVLAALGDKDVKNIEKSQIALAHLQMLLMTIDRNGTYICYIPDKRGVVREVRVTAAHCGWRINSPEIEDTTRPCMPGDKIISAA